VQESQPGWTSLSGTFYLRSIYAIAISDQLLLYPEGVMEQELIYPDLVPILLLCNPQQGIVTNSMLWLQIFKCT
jgi:hypothetical protein